MAQQNPLPPSKALSETQDCSRGVTSSSKSPVVPWADRGTAGPSSRHLQARDTWTLKFLQVGCRKSCFCIQDKVSSASIPGVGPREPHSLVPFHLSKKTVSFGDQKYHCQQGRKPLGTNDVEAENLDIVISTLQLRMSLIVIALGAEGSGTPRSQTHRSETDQKSWV